MIAASDPDLLVALWSAWLRRFDIEYAFRFLAQHRSFATREWLGTGR